MKRRIVHLEIDPNRLFDELMTLKGAGSSGESIGLRLLSVCLGKAAGRELVGLEFYGISVTKEEDLGNAQEQGTGQVQPDPGATNPS